MPSPSISQAAVVQRMSERPQRMHPAATAHGVTKGKEDFWKFQQAHTPENPKPPLPATLFTFISWSEGIFQVRKEEKKTPGRKHCRRKRNN